MGGRDSRVPSAPAAAHEGIGAGRVRPLGRRRAGARLGGADPAHARVARSRRRAEGVRFQAQAELDGTMSLKLGLSTGLLSGREPLSGVFESVQEAERLGFDSVWASETYGSDALTPLAWWGSQTTKLKLGTTIVQISARRPAATAMAAMTMDHLSGGRFILGLGVSGPQVVEGWYGEPFAKPLARMREYVSIVRDVTARRAPVSAGGPHYPLPLNGREGSTGLGKPLKSILHPLRERIPLYVAAQGPKNIALAAEIGDGWLPLYYSPQHDDELYRPSLEAGFARRGGDPEEFEIAPSVPFILHDGVERAADMLRPMYALYFGGMGARE